MRIGIDLDGVVIDSEKQFRNASELYDINILKKNSMIEPTELSFQKRYNWSKEESQRFIDEYFIKCTEKSSIMPGAKEVIELLKSEGHEFIVITARGHDLEPMIAAAQKILERENITFDKYYWKIQNKAEICKKENIDIMIEDSLKNCEEIAKENIQTIYLRDSNMKPANNEKIKECYIWGEIYRYIKEISK